MLVVVEDGDVQDLPQPALDLEAARRGDVLEVDAAEDRGESDDRADDLVDVLCREADRKGVDAAELLEEHGLALHDGQSRLRPMSPSPSTALPSVTTATVFCLIGEAQTFAGSAAIALETRATPGVYAIDRSSRVLSGVRGVT